MGTSARIELLFPPGLGRPGRWRPHLGMAYLQAALAAKGIVADQCLPPRGTSAADVAAEVVSRRPCVVGFSVYDANFRACLNLARRIKHARPGIRVVFGGPTPTFAWRWILPMHRSVDICVLGESEDTGPALFSSLLGSPSRAQDLASIPGLAFRVNGQPFWTGLAPLAGGTTRGGAPLDCLPSPYLTGVLADGRAGVLTARGCTHSCVYCCFAALGRRSHRVHSPERVVNELSLIAERRRRAGRRCAIPVFDDTFGLQPARAREICERIAERELGLKLSCLTRGDALDLATLRAMKRAGFISLGLGLESAVPSVLRAIGKVRPADCPDPSLQREADYLERFEATVRWAKELGFTVGVSIMTGLPMETEDEGARTVRFVDRLPVDHYLHNVLRVVPGTPLWETQERYGIASRVETLGLPVTSRWPYDWTRIRPGQRSDAWPRGAVLRWRAITAAWGCGAPAADGRGLWMAVVRAERLGSETARWLSGILAMGGWLVQVYCDSRLLTDRTTLDVDRQTAVSALVPYRHYLQLVPEVHRGATGRWRVLSELSDALERHDLPLLTVSAHEGVQPLEDWVAGRPRTADVCDVRPPLLPRASQARFARHLHARPLARLLLTHAPPPVIAYSGRWTDAEPPCLRLGRLEVDERGLVRTCRHGGVLGAVGDTPAVLAERLHALSREAAERRSSLCGVRGRPPGCPFPDLDDRTYCDAFKRPRTRLWSALDFLSRIPGLLIDMDADGAGGAT